jgi:uncharacterized protein YcnI
MRCSAWSSLAISVCSGLLFAASAAAHVIAKPSFLTGGRVSTLTLEAPNERDAPMTALRVTVPQGFTIVSARSTGAWAASASGRVVTWRGGRLAGRRLQIFTLELKAPDRAGSVQLDALQLYPDDEVVRWPVSVTVVPGEEPSQNLGAALVAGVIGLLGLTAVAVFLWQRRASPKLQEK